MANFVLVHGAWHGGWCWRDVAAVLRAAGHLVFTPTHTGVGERAHQSHESITLETHVRDVAGCIEMEELDQVILCGHSYGGMVITQLADRMPEKIKALVYLDAYVPEHGECVFDLVLKALPPELAASVIERQRGSAQSENGCGLMQPTSVEAFGVKEEHQAWIERRCVPQSLATFEMPVLLSGAAQSIDKRVYIVADGWDPSPFRYFAEILQQTPSWEVKTMPCGHEVMIDMPDELAVELLKLV